MQKQDKKVRDGEYKEIFEGSEMMRRWACKHRKWYSYGWDLKDWNFGIQIDFMCRHFTFSFGPWWIMLWWNKEDWDIEDMGEEIEDKEGEQIGRKRQIQMEMLKMWL